MINSDFSYLQIPKSLYQRQPQINNAVIELQGKKRRVLYYNVPIHQDQLQQIQNFKSYALKNNVTVDCGKQDILRYLYATQFKYKDALQKIKVFLQWTHNPLIQNINSKTQIILNEGVAYTFGRDKNQRPIIYINVSDIDVQKYTLDQYYSAVNAVMTVVIKYLFVKGSIQKYLFVIDMGGKNFTSLPFNAILSIISKLTTVYTNHLGRMLILNANFIFKVTYAAIKKFVHPQTVRRIELLGTDQLQKILQQVDDDQLEKRHCGSLQNLPIYWPPKVPGCQYEFKESQTLYYTILQENLKFLDEEQLANQTESSCCQANSCNLF